MTITEKKTKLHYLKDHNSSSQKGKTVTIKIATNSYPVIKWKTLGYIWSELLHSVKEYHVNGLLRRERGELKQGVT